MTSRRYKDRDLQQMYDACREMGQDQSSPFWFSDRDGTRRPRRGAGHRAAYWNGRSGLPNRTYPRGSRGYVCYMAGQDDLRDFGPVEKSEYRA